MMPKAFDRNVIEMMARISLRPITFLHSKPTSLSECAAEAAYACADGRAIFGSGSPFGPVRHRNRIIIPSQCNNMYIFPAMGLAASATRAALVTDAMFIAAAQALMEQIAPSALEGGLLYPPQTNIFATELHVAQRVAELIFAEGLAVAERPRNLNAFIETQLYKPGYPVFI